MFRSCLTLSILVFLNGNIQADSTARPLTMVKSIVVKQSIKGSEGNSIDTVRRSPHRDRRLFRAPPGRENPLKKTAYPLVYVRPGGLETVQSSYYFPLDKELGGIYVKETFSFSGPATSLVYLNGMGWGTENNNNDFFPYLVQKDYRKVKDATYSFFWEEPHKKGGIQGNIYLNYEFRVPRDTRVKWGTENSFDRFSFGGGASVNVPGVNSSNIFRFRDGRLENVNPSVNISRSRRCGFPAGLDIEGIAVPESGVFYVVACGDGSVRRYNSDGNLKWRISGRAPVIFSKNDRGVFFQSADGDSIVFADSETGKSLTAGFLPRFLPLYGNSISLVTLSSGRYLLLQVPEQSRIICYKISASLQVEYEKPEND